MIHRRIAHHFAPHEHENGEVHLAHGSGILALFSYLQIFVLVIGAFYIIRVKAPQILGTASFSGDQIITLTNQKRTENGLPALTRNQQLSQAAAGKAADMLANDYWAHNSPQGKTPWVFITGAGYKYVFAGENLARDFDDAQSVVNAWMNSPSHRSNLLDKNFRDIGVAVESGKLTGHDGILVVQEFGSSVQSAPVDESKKVASNDKPIVSPVPTATSAPQVVESAAPVTQAVESVEANANQSKGESAQVLSSRQFSVARGISLAVVSLVFLLFLTEVVLSVRSSHLEMRTGIIAHLGILALVLFAVWYAAGGAII